MINNFGKRVTFIWAIVFKDHRTHTLYLKAYKRLVKLFAHYTDSIAFVRGKARMLRKRSSTGSDWGLGLGEGTADAHPDVLTLQPAGAAQQTFSVSVPTVWGWLDEQAGGRPWIQSAEEDFFQVGHPRGSLLDMFHNLCSRQSTSRCAWQ